MKSALIAVLAPVLLIFETSAVAQAPRAAEMNDLKAQIEALREQQTRSLQVIESLEKRIDAMERAETAPASSAPIVPGNEAPIATATSERAPGVQRRDLYSEDRIPAPRIDNAPINPDMEGFFHIGGTPTMMRLGGYAKLDVIHDFKLPGDPDAFVTSSLPLGPVPAANVTNIHARQSRINAEVRRPTPYGPLRVYFESDLFGAGPTIFALRHLYGQLNNVLAGWTFSAFMDIDSFPDSVDFEGPGGAVFTDQPQFRYTWPVTKANSLAFSVEKPTTDVIVTNPDYPNVAVATPTSPIPDFVVRYRYEVPKGHLQLGTVLRSVGGAVAQPNNSFTSGHVFGWGVNLSGALQTYGKDSILFQGAHGHGIGRYIQDLIGLGADASLNASNKLVATPALGTFIAYQHYWTPAWRSTATYGYAEVQNQAGQAATFYHKTNYSSFNAIWNPFGSLNIGAEYIYGNLTAKNANRGFGSRMQLSVQYDFFKWSKEAQ